MGVCRRCSWCVFNGGNNFRDQLYRYGIISFPAVRAKRSRARGLPLGALALAALGTFTSESPTHPLVPLWRNGSRASANPRLDLMRAGGSRSWPIIHDQPPWFPPASDVCHTLDRIRSSLALARGPGYTYRIKKVL